MKKEMLINVLQPEECRIAIVENGILEELYLERTSLENYTGNIYKGRIVNIEPAIQAAFVDFSVGRNGFLHVSDVEPRYYKRLLTEDVELGARDRGRDPRRNDRNDEPRAPRGRDRDRPRNGRGDEPRAPRPPAAGLDHDADEPPARSRDWEHDDYDRPDRSEKGRRDRSERRFGEGLSELWGDSPPPPAREERPARAEEPPAPSRPAPELESEPEPIPSWNSRRAARPAEPRPPAAEEAEDFRPARSRPADPIESELPPSRTHRARRESPPAPRHPQADLDIENGGEPEPSAPPETESRGRERTDREPRRRRGRRTSSSSADRGAPSTTPEPAPEPAAGGFGAFPDDDERWLPAAEAPEAPSPAAEPPESPRRRSGRDAIRARGGDRPRDISAQHPRGLASERPYEPPAEPSPEPERERERPRGRGRGESRSAETGRGTGAGSSRAGEPGYVPRRERSRDVEPAAAPWPELDDELTPDLGETSMDDLAALDDTHTDEDDQGDEPRRRRRRRRRRNGGRDDEPTRAEGRPGEPAESDQDEHDQEPAPAPARPPARSRRDVEDRGRAPRRPSRRHDRDEFAHDHDHDHDHDDDLAHDEPFDDDHDDLDDELEPVVTRSPEEDRIDPELEEEIRREIEEIAELEREMGLRGGIAEPHPREEEPSGRRDAGWSARGRAIKPPIQEVFTRGNEVLVQVIKESIGTKGPTLSTYISIPGRYLVLMPGLNRVGVSRKIADESQRRKLREIMNELNPPKGLGFIVRTAGLDRSKRDLARDLAYLLRLWKVILKRIKKARTPSPIYQESDMITRTIRDVFTSDIDTIWIDEPQAFERAQEFLRVVMPKFVNRLKLYDEKVPLFHKYGIEEEIAKIQRRHVPLPEGGSIVIDQTEALVAIDVNSGNFRVEDDAEKTAYEMNLRAAKEIARQLRLRDLGGVIVNDFIDMRDEKHRRGVERALRDAVKRDRARTKILRMSQFGLVEMTRQRIRPSLKRSVYEDCAYCKGAGVTKSAESMAIDVMRLLTLAAYRPDVTRIQVTVSAPVASYLNNRKRPKLSQLETEGHLTIVVGQEVNVPAEYLQIDCFDAQGAEVRGVFPTPAPTHTRRGR